MRSIPSKIHKSKDETFYNRQKGENVLENELKKYKQRKSEKMQYFPNKKKKIIEQKVEKLKNNRNNQEENEIRNILGVPQSKNHLDLLRKETELKSKYGKLKKKFEETHEYNEKFKNVEKDGSLKLNNPINFHKEKDKKIQGGSNGKQTTNKQIKVIYKPIKEHLVVVDEKEDSIEDKDYLNSYPDKFKLYEAGKLIH